jgi:hypothetical protein
MIKNTDIETLYNKIDGRINLIGSYIGDPELLPKIIKSCRLKPYSIFSGNHQSKTVFEHHWVDEFGNSLKIEDKTLKIVMNDIQINKNTKISTDLFFGYSIDRVAKNSKCVLVINGEFFDEPCYCAVFYGKDEFLRSFFWYKELTKISPLLLGINTLREFFKNIHNLIKSDIDKNKIDMSIKFNVLDCIVCWEPAGWKDHIKGECK